MKHKRALYTAILAAVCACSLAANVSAADTPQTTNAWISLFNGKDLKDWDIKIAGHELGDNYGDTFRVENGLLRVCYDKYDAFGGKFGHIFYRGVFTNYILRVEYRFVGKQAPGGPGWAFRNSGAMIHGQSAESMGKEQKFPVSIEVQMLGGDGEKKRSTGNLCTPGTHVVMDGKRVTRHVINSSSETFHGDQWVILEVEVRGSQTIKHKVNGKQVLEYEKPQLDSGKLLDSGTISLQAESHPVEFRKVQLLPLDPP